MAHRLPSRWSKQLRCSLGLLAVLTVGCRTGFAPPSPELMQSLHRRGTSIARGRAEPWVTLRSEHVSGEFQGVLVATRTGGRTKVRMQLFPDLGGKILDVLASSDRLWGSVPGGGLELDTPLPEVAPRGFLTFVALTLLENQDPFFDVRVKGERKTSTGHEVEFESTWPGLEVIADIDSSGLLTARHYRYRNVAWHEQVESDTTRVITGDGFHMRIEKIQWEHDPDLPDAAFLIEAR